MKIILDILTHAGGYRPDLYLHIENPPYSCFISFCNDSEKWDARVNKEIGR